MPRACKAKVSRAELDTQPRRPPSRRVADAESGRGRRGAVAYARPSFSSTLARTAPRGRARFSARRTLVCALRQPPAPARARGAGRIWYEQPAAFGRTAPAGCSQLCVPKGARATVPC
eukprot:3053370-Prymnesium_polylepis.1